MNVSPAERLIRDLVARRPDDAARVLRVAIDSLSVVELAALAHDWEGMWARPTQIIDLSAARTHGFLTARRVGKTRADIEWVTAEAEAGRAMRIGFCAQNEDKALEVLVHGDCGFLAVSPPWFKAKWENGRVLWPNGAQAFPFTPEVPGAIRGPGVHVFLASELQSWPHSTMFEAFYNAMLMTSLGQARMLWEATPKRGHPLIMMLQARAQAEPHLHIIKTGRIDDNAGNLGAGVVAAMHKALDGTQRGREELDGIMSDSDDEALWQMPTIANNRRPMPSGFARRVIALDPAIGTKEDSDSSGIADVGLGKDGQVYVIADLTGKHAGLALADLAICRYLAGGCDLMLIETNRGGSWGVELLRAVAEKHRVRIEVVDARWAVKAATGVVFVREINSKGSKAERASPVVTRYELGKVSHVIGADLTSLEFLMTTWVPPPPGTRGGGRRSPDALDAVVMAIVELAGLKSAAADPSAAFRGLETMGRELAAQTGGVGRMPVSASAAVGLAALLPRSEWGSKI